MYKALNNSTYRRGPRTHTHPKENGPRGSLFGRAWPGYLPASCGHTDSKPTRWDSNPQPEVHGPRPWLLGHQTCPPMDRRPLEPRPPLSAVLSSFSTNNASERLLRSERFPSFLPLASRLDGASRGVCRGVSEARPRRGSVVAFGTLASHWLGHACDARPSLIGWRKRPCPPSERSLDLWRWRLRPRLQPKTRGQWRPGRVREVALLLLL